MAIFLKALLTGFAIAIPLGPINVVCIKQTIRLGLAGFCIVALAAGISNIILSSIAATGSIVLIKYLKTYQSALHFIGGMTLISFGIMELYKDDCNYSHTFEKNLYSVFFKVITIALSNPITILGYMSLMFELTGKYKHPSIVLSIILGLTLASVIWRLCLGSLILKLKSEYILKYLNYLKIICPLCFFYFGINSMLKAIF